VLIRGENQTSNIKAVNLSKYKLILKIRKEIVLI